MDGIDSITLTWDTHGMRAGRHVAGALVWAGLTLLCGSACVCSLFERLPVPLVVGPDSGWVRAPVRFHALYEDGGEIPVGNAIWTWGDGSSTADPEHVYARPHTYLVTCRQYQPGSVEKLTRDRYSAPSDPCTLRIIDDPDVYPDSVSDTVKVGRGANAWACISPDGNRLYATNRDSGTVSVIDTRTNSVVKAVPVQSDPGRCLVSNSGQDVYVANAGSNSVSVVSTGSDSVRATIRLPGVPGALAILPDDSLLVVAHEREGLVAVFRTSDGTQVVSVALGDEPRGLAVKPPGDLLYVACKNGIRVVRTADFVVVTSVAMAGEPSDILFSGSGETAYVTCPSSGSIVLLRASDNSRIGQITYVDFDLLGVRRPTMSPSDRYFYILDDAGSMIGIVRRRDNQLIRLVHLYGSPSNPKARVAVEHPSLDRTYVPTFYGLLVLTPQSSP